MNPRYFYLAFGAANVSLVLYGILALLKPDILLEPFSVHVYQFPTEATVAIAYLSALFRLLGFFNLIIGTLGLILLYRYKAERQGWLRKTVIASTTLTFIGPIVFDNTVGSIGFFEVVEHVLFLFVVLVGFIMLRNPTDQMAFNSHQSQS